MYWQEKSNKQRRPSKNFSSGIPTEQSIHKNAPNLLFWCILYLESREASMKRKFLSIFILFLLLMDIHAKTLAYNNSYIDDDSWYFNDDMNNVIYFENTNSTQTIKNHEQQEVNPLIELNTTPKKSIENSVENQENVIIRKQRISPREYLSPQSQEINLIRTIAQPQHVPTKIKIPAGTAISVSVENEIDADDVREGENINFVVLEPVSIDGTIVIKSGTHVTAQVIKKKNNFILGIPGEIEIGNFKLFNHNNEVINLRGAIIDKGAHRAWVNIGWIFVWPLLFVKGNDGKISAGTYKILYTIGDSYYKL